MNDNTPAPSHDSNPNSSPAAAVDHLKHHKTGVLRTILAGALMGIANIIPGVSGGTIILALGLYEQFVESVASLTRLRLRWNPIFFLLLLGISSAVAIALMAKPINWGLTNHHHVMFALFIGLTLGGVPLILKEMGKFTPPAIVGAIAGMAVMIFVLYLKFMQIQLPQTWIVFFIMGIVASAAMVLPGISGSYILLVAGLYLPITKAIEHFAHALKAGDWANVWTIGWGVGAPVALGIVVGIAGLTNLLKALLKNYHAPTLGVLLGLLIGSVFGLYPFSPLTEKGEVLAAPHPITPLNLVLVLLALALGFGITLAISRLGKEEATEGKAF